MIMEEIARNAIKQKMLECQKLVPEYFTDEFIDKCIKEIEQRAQNNGVDTMPRPQPKEPEPELPKCVKCGATMVWYKNHDFFGCSNYRITGCNYKISNAQQYMDAQKERLKAQKQESGQNNEFVCGWLEEQMKLERELNERREKTRARLFEREQIIVVPGCEVDITHPDFEGIWHINIVPQSYEYTPYYTGGGDKRINYKQQLSGVNINENKIAEETPLAQSLIGKKEGDEYSYETPDGVITGKVIKIYK